MGVLRVVAGAGRGGGLLGEVMGELKQTFFWGGWMELAGGV